MTKRWFAFSCCALSFGLMNVPATVKNSVSIAQEQKAANTIGNATPQQSQTAPQANAINGQVMQETATDPAPGSLEWVKELSDLGAGKETRKNAASEETTVTVKGGTSAINEKNRENKTLAYTLATNIQSVSDMSPVAALTGKELNNRNMSIPDQIASFFKTIGNKVMRKGFGDVSLGEYGVGGMMNHRPINRAKMVSLAAVPDVIQNGRQIGYDPNWKGRGYASYIFAAPVTVNGTDVYVAAVVDKRPDNKFYLSEMVDSEGNYVRIEESPSGNSKNGVTDGAGNSGKAGVTARPEGLPEGGNPSTTSAEPTPLFNTSISQTAPGVNTDSSQIAQPDMAAMQAYQIFDNLTENGTGLHSSYTVNGITIDLQNGAAGVTGTFGVSATFYNGDNFAPWDIPQEFDTFAEAKDYAAMLAITAADYTGGPTPAEKFYGRPLNRGKNSIADYEGHGIHSKDGPVGEKIAISVQPDPLEMVQDVLAMGQGKENGQTVDTETQAEYDNVNNQGGITNGAGEENQTIYRGRTDSTYRVQEKARTETDGRPRIQKELGKAGDRPTETVSSQKNTGLKDVPLLYDKPNHVTPESGSLLENTQRTFVQDYGIECYIIKDSAWREENPACSQHGKVYIQESINEATLSTAVPHESTHAMGQNGFAPYINFLPVTQDSINAFSESGQKLLYLVGAHSKVDRKGFGIIDFAKKRLKAAFKYFDSGSAEEAAFEALPYVLENGIEISSHSDHKGRDYRTVTIAAPVLINGKRGNMAVVVKQTDGNHYKVHRILTPDGSVFDLSETTNEADRADGGVTETGSLATSNGAASSETSVIGDTAAGHRQTQPLVPAPDTSISQTAPGVNTNSSQATQPDPLEMVQDVLALGQGKENGQTVDTETQAEYDNENNQGEVINADTQGRSVYSGRDGRNAQSNSQRETAGSAENGGGNTEIGPQSRTAGGRDQGNVYTADSEGRRLTPDQSEKLQDTAVTDGNGAPLAVYHVTDNMEFTTFAKGDTGFHFGSAEQATRHAKKRGFAAGRIFRAYLNIQSPVRMPYDIMGWNPNGTALHLWGNGITPRSGRT